MAKDAYDVDVDAANEHCHGFAGVEGTHGDLFGAEADILSNVPDAGADGVDDVLAFEDAPLCAVVVACNRYLCGGTSTL